MATFKALNLESDDESDIEVDNTKELQIEEALKLYQNALKYHSDGPASYPNAADAYKQLFDSDIFKYPEALTELRRIELYGPSSVNASWVDVSAGEAVVPLAPGDNAPSTLPQILHLAHKNHGDFMLDSLRYRASQALTGLGTVGWTETRDAAIAALDHFVEALDKDESDNDVWKQSSATGSLLNSKRIARFCLEAILEGEDDALNDLLAFPGFDQSAASDDLLRIAQELQDSLSLLQAPLSDIKAKQLREVLRRRLLSQTHGDDGLDKLRVDPRTLDAITDEESHRLIDLRKPPTWTDLALVLAESNQSTTSSSARPYAVGILNFSTEVDAEVDEDLGMTDAPTHDHLYYPAASDISACFPGLDGGLPTVARPAWGGVLQLLSFSAKDYIAAALPTRKRSSDAAVLETPDTGRIKSKRLRARESLVEGLPAIEDTLLSAKKPKKDPFEETEYNDTWSFNSTDDILKKLGVSVFDQLATARPHRANGSADISATTSPAILSAGQDIYQLLAESPESMPRLATSKGDRSEVDTNFMHLLSALETDTKSQARSAAKPSLDVQAGLHAFLIAVNEASLTGSEAAFTLIQLLLMPSSNMVQPALSKEDSSYTGHSWPDELCSAVKTLLLSFDGYICNNVSQLLEQQTSHRESFSSLPSISQLAELVEAIFELHLEILSQVSFAEVGAGVCGVEEQVVRTERWSDLAKESMKLRQLYEGDDMELDDSLNLRYVWAAAVQIKMADRVDQSKVLACLQELREIFAALSGPVISLPNNSLMPILSLDAIDREIAKLTTSDFFAKVFAADSADPAAIIEGLEPLLEFVHNRRLDNKDGKMDANHDNTTMAFDDDEMVLDSPLPASQELIDFLCGCSSSVIMALWQRLRAAYQNIDYIPMVAVCIFRMVEVLTSDFESPAFQEQGQGERQQFLLKHLKQINDSLLKILEMTKISTDVLSCMDLARIKSISNSLVAVLKVLQYANFAQDEIRVGERTAPFEKDASKAKTYRMTTTLLHEAQLSAWITLYLLVQEAAKELPLELPKEEFDRYRMEMLRSVHTSVGGRGFCEGANRILLNLLKKELPALRHVAGYDFEFSQVLLDLYGLNCFINPSWESLPHDCSRDVSLDRAAAVQIVDLLLMQVAKIKLADLHKHTLRESFERVHLVVARKKASQEVLRNREIYNQFFKSPINPIDLFRCLKGNGEINLTTLPDKLAALSNKGWYFVMGYLCLSRFRSQKRNPNTPTEDLEEAISFFSQDLEYNSEKWETWFRLGQAFDSLQDDHVTWRAEKLNENMDEVAQLQRSVIHCYRMATALATRITDPEFESSAAVAELYADFAARVYASSRPPFSMQAFTLQGATRYLSTNGLVQVAAFRPLTEYTAWKFAKTLFQRAISGNTEQWSLHYMLGKCLWKMHNATAEQAGTRKRPDLSLVIHALQRAIELLPRERRDRKEPILEPHYKIVSIVHKLMSKRDAEGRLARTFSLKGACDIIRTTPYAKRVPVCEDVDEWESYVLNILKQLRNADKSNWHHRMIARAARIVYGETSGGSSGFDYAAALGAKHELTQQLFTKTMVLQVWRPDLERAGRHFVYTVQYTRLFMGILEGLGEKASMEALARRVRKRSGDYFGHTELWSEIFLVYIRMMRRAGKVPLGKETTVFSGMDNADFRKQKDVLEKWCQTPDTKDASLDTLRDALEFKKVNANLCKGSQLDDLIGDTYAHLFDTKGKELWNEHLQTVKAEKEAQALAETRTVMNLSNFISNEGTPAATALEPPPSTVEAPGESTPVKRKTGVGRREIRNCADACVAKFANQPVFEPEAPKREPQVIIRRQRRTSDVSPRGSGGENADDESELSEVDEDLVQLGHSPTARMSMFPNLKVETDGAADEDGEDEDVEAGDGEEDGGEGDDEADGGEEDEVNDNEDHEMGDDDEAVGDHIKEEATGHTTVMSASRLPSAPGSE